MWGLTWLNLDKGKLLKLNFYDLFVECGSFLRFNQNNTKGAIDVNKKQLMLNPQNEVHLLLNLPKDIDTYKKLQKHMLWQYHIDVDLSCEYFGDLFYNADLRSFMGFVYEFGNPCYLVLFPQYYIDKDNLASQWSKWWRALVRQSEAVEQL